MCDVYMHYFSFSFTQIQTDIDTFIHSIYQIMCDHHLFLIVLPNDWTHSTQIENGYRVDERRSTGDDGQTPECDRLMPVIVEHVSSSLCQVLIRSFNIIFSYRVNSILVVEMCNLR